MSPRFSVIIPTFDRAQVVGESIRSVVAWTASAPVEIVVIDDGSVDGTAERIRHDWSALLDSGVLKFHRMPCNSGVTHAKNAGAAHASGDWLVFLDSDDALVAGAGAVIERACAAHAAAPVIFFRCIDPRGALIGAPTAVDVPVGARDTLVAWPWGECLPVVRADAFAACPYDAAFQGHEAIAYARMIGRFGRGYVAAQVARRYDDQGADRLSTVERRKSRACALAAGYRRMLFEFTTALGTGGCLHVTARIFYYTMLCFTGSLHRAR